MTGMKQSFRASEFALAIALLGAVGGGVVHAEAISPASANAERRTCMAAKDALRRAACLDALLTEVLLSWSDDRGRSSAALASIGESARRQAIAADQEKDKLQLQALMKPFLALQAARESGVSLNAYQPLVLSASTEVAQARAGVYGAKGEAAAPTLAEAVDAFGDAASWWQADIEFYARRDNRIAYPGGLPVGLARVERLVNRYSIPTGKADTFGLNQGAQLQPALRAIWLVADKAIERAQAILQAPQMPTAVPAVAPVPARTASSPEGWLPNGCPAAAPDCSWGSKVPN